MKIAPTLFFQPELSLKTEFAGADWRWKRWKTLENVGNVGNVSTLETFPTFTLESP
jgi:hypothetical protein